MMRDELDMLQLRLEELNDIVYKHVLVESPVTHRGVPKPLFFEENKERFSPWLDKIIHVIATPRKDLPPWGKEHFQRDKAWESLHMITSNDDIIFICDIDEIPSKEVSGYLGETALTLGMRTCIYAVDWEVPGQPLPTCVIARAGFIREHQVKGLGGIRDGRGTYPYFANGGWHLSWLGGPEKQREKLETATCHTEIYDTPEADLILDGTRYQTGNGGSALAVVPVDVDESFPAMIREKRCPQSWFRPRS